ncbi:MAG: bacteriocin fulvocin C-related protein [Cyclobacteriaceae bacterium]|nr:bacteriocin fulvocin C-related protein [Cyclobacteriaceae bacterium]
MKRVNFCLTLAVVIVWGCSTFEEPDDAVQLSTARVTQLFALKPAEQKMAFEMLDAQEKAQVWKMSVNNALRADYFNGTQEAVVQELLNFIGDRIPQDARTIAAFEHRWLAKAGKVFDDDKIYSLAYNINSNGMNLVDPDDPAIVKCNCHRGSEWSCGPITVEWWCPDAPSNCKKPTKSGCGFMWLYSCNQVCVFEPL